MGKNRKTLREWWNTTNWFYAWLAIRHPSSLIRYIKFWIEWKERPPIGVMLLDDRELTEEEYNYPSTQELPNEFLDAMEWGEEKLLEIKNSGGYTEHGDFGLDLPHGELIGRWAFPEILNLSGDDWVEYEPIIISTDSYVLKPFRYRVHKEDGTVGEWRDMIPENE